MLFVYVAYKTSQYDYEYANFDPYDILQIEVGASQADIKSAYRKLSRIYHPDKQTGDEKTFLKITRAHQVMPIRFEVLFIVMSLLSISFIGFDG